MDALRDLQERVMDWMLDGKTDDEICKLVDREYQARLERDKHLFFEGINERLGYFQELTSAWVDGLDAARAHEAEGDALIQLIAKIAVIEEGLRKFEEREPAVREEMAGEIATVKQKIKEWKQLQESLKPRPSYAIYRDGILQGY